jgi:Sortase domain
VQGMRSVKLAVCLLALNVVLALGGCGQGPPLHTSQKKGLSLALSPAVQHTTGSTLKSTVERKANPVRLLISAIGIDATVEEVGVTPAGDLAVPKQNPWQDVGWYESGPRPGERGSAVIDGHLDRPGGYPAVFWRLRDMRIGDEVVVMDAFGKTLRFHVRDIEFYSPQDAPIQEIFGNETGTYLNLITCAGDWIASQHQTTLRLVIYTSLD